MKEKQIESNAQFFTCQVFKKKKTIKNIVGEDMEKWALSYFIGGSFSQCILSTGHFGNLNLNP